MRANVMKSHPLFVGAALSVILCALVAAAAITGVIPSALSSRSAAQAGAPAATAACDNCGTIQSIRQVQLNGSASGVGAVAGGLTGAVVGHQFGRGDGRTALTVLGAAGGAYAGNAIEKDMKKSTAWRITVLMDDASHRTVSQPEHPALAVGDKVRVLDGRVFPLK